LARHGPICECQCPAPVRHLQRVGNELNNAEYLREVRDRQGENISVAFKRECPNYIPTQRNYETVVETMAFNALSASQQEGTVEEMTDGLIDGGFWTVANLKACYNALTAEGLLDVPAGTARNLSERERLHVTRLAQVGRTEEAVSQYLKYAIYGEEPSIEILHDPNYRQVCDDAVVTVFEANQADYAPTPERERYLLRYAAGRPLTLMLVEQAWRACQQHEQWHERGQILEQYQRPEQTPPPSAKEIDALSDEQIDKLYHSSLRALVTQRR
jgi:hypothetical protein